MPKRHKTRAVPEAPPPSPSEEEEEEEEYESPPQYEWIAAPDALRGGGKGEVRMKLKASCTSSLRPHTLVAQGLIH